MYYKCIHSSAVGVVEQDRGNWDTLVAEFPAHPPSPWCVRSSRVGSPFQHLSWVECWNHKAKKGSSALEPCSSQSCITGRALGRLGLALLLNPKSSSKDLSKHTLFSFLWSFSPSKHTVSHHCLFRTAQMKSLSSKNRLLPLFTYPHLYLAPHSCAQKCKHCSAPALPSHQYFHCLL